MRVKDESDHAAALKRASERVSSRSGRSGSRNKRFLTATDASLLGLGTQMFSEVAAGVLLGLGVDYMLGTQGRWLVVGSIAGIVVAMFSLIRLAIKLQPKKGAASASPVGQRSPSAQANATSPTPRDSTLRDSTACGTASGSHDSAQDESKGQPR